jgi:hypothetical protein
MPNSGAKRLKERESIVWKLFSGQVLQTYSLYIKFDDFQSTQQIEQMITFLYR